LAFGFACIFSAKRCSTLYEQLREEIKNDKFTTMKDLHSIVSAFKGLHMQESLNGFFKVRECCGAHGYSSYSNIPNIIEIWSPNVTLEGDTMVMYQQTAKGILKSFRLMKDHDKSIKGIYSYLNDFKALTWNIDSLGIQSSDDLLSFLKIACLQNIYRVDQLIPDFDDEVEFSIGWNKIYQIDIIAMSHLNAHYLNALMFDQELKSRSLSPPLKTVLFDLLKLYVSEVLTKHTSILHFEGAKPQKDVEKYPVLGIALTAEKLMDLSENFEALIEQIRPHAYKLTNSFIINDLVLHSKLSMKHGKVYEEMFTTAMNSKLNKKTSLEGVHEYLKPLSRKLIRSSKL
jgi:acyl-CoA oxidase